MPPLELLPSQGMEDISPHRIPPTTLPSWPGNFQLQFKGLLISQSQAGLFLGQLVPASKGPPHTEVIYSYSLVCDFLFQGTQFHSVH